MKDFKEKLALVPSKPGSYQMKNKDGLIIYVGKAKNLQRRLRSYFTRTVTGKTKMLVEDIDDFEYELNFFYINKNRILSVLVVALFLFLIPHNLVLFYFLSCHSLHN